MEVTKYKTGQVRDIESILARYEAEILETRTEIERGYKEPHLNYAFKPYYTQGDYIKIRGIFFFISLIRFGRSIVGNPEPYRLSVSLSYWPESSR